VEVNGMNSLKIGTRITYENGNENSVSIRFWAGQDELSKWTSKQNIAL
jgi:hypothetical protein